MLKFGDVGQNILTLVVLAGFGYLIYAKWQEKKGGENALKGLFTKAGEVATKRVDMKGGGGNQFGR